MITNKILMNFSKILLLKDNMRKIMEIRFKLKNK